MKKKYFINKVAQVTGEHEIHVENCKFMPNKNNKRMLGKFNNCKEAIYKAKSMGYFNVDGCKFCSGPCHTK